MSFVETVRRARELLQQETRLSFRALKREFHLEDDALEDLLYELVTIQQVATREDIAVVWSTPPARPAPADQSRREPFDYTPRHLAEKILRSKSSLEGERKLVTVLFADVKGSMELAAQLDAEEWHDILDRFFRILSEGVHRFEGTVNQYTGDGIMALFGAPIAHEDHAQRACFAALHMRDALNGYSDELRLSRRLDFAVRIGINTGHVVVGKIGDNLRMDYTAQGVTVGLAQRMEQMAAAHSICVSEATMGIVAGYFDLRDLGTAIVKGLEVPVRVFELTGVGQHRTRLDASRSRGLTRFVGRESDLGILEQALEQASAGNGRVVGVVAEAGVGKSRLCHEFVERCRARGISVNEGHCPSHGRTIAYLPLLELLRDIFEIEDRDGAHETRRKVAGELLLLDASFQQVLPLVFEFLGVPDPEHPVPYASPEMRRKLLGGFLRHLMEARSEHAPHVVLIDDAHWIDEASDAFLAEAIAGAGQTHTLWVVNFRPEYRGEWMEKLSFHRRLPLLPLGRAAVDELLAHLLGSDVSLVGLLDQIHSSTGGNPFFIEEVVLSLVESGGLVGARGAYGLARQVKSLEIPPSVQSVLAARIDRLPEQEKQLLQTASVVGRELRDVVLRRVAKISEAERADAIAALVQKQFLVEKTLYPEAEYAFKHPLTHEVAYDSQLADRRATTHAAIARAVEEIDAHRLDERAALLAHHWEAARDDTMAARWHARAARGHTLDDVNSALFHWVKVRSLLQSASDSEERTSHKLEAAVWLLAYGWRLGMSDEEAKAILEEGIELAQRSGDLGSHALLLGNFVSVHVTVGNPAEVGEATRESLELAQRSGNRELQWALLEGMIDHLHFTGQLREADRVCAEFVEMAVSELQPGTSVRGIPVAWCFGYRGWLKTSIGSLDEAEESLRRCERALSGTEYLEFLSFLHCVYSHHRYWAGDAAAARAYAGRGFDGAEKVGSTLGVVWAHLRLGSALALAGEWGEATRHLELSLDLARTTRCWLTVEAEILAHLAEAYLGAGDTAAALRIAAEAIEVGRRRKTLMWEAHGHLVLARALLATSKGNEKEIRRELDVCATLVDQTGANIYLPHIHELRAALAGRLGDRVAYARELDESHRHFVAMGATSHAERLSRLRGFRTG